MRFKINRAGRFATASPEEKRIGDYTRCWKLPISSRGANVSPPALTSLVTIRRHNAASDVAFAGAHGLFFGLR